jgi:hypothetical protein
VEKPRLAWPRHLHHQAPAGIVFLLFKSQRFCSAV